MPSKEAQLEDLLKSLFPLPGELHRFLGRLDQGHDLIDSIKGTTVPLVEVAHDAVVALDARGLLTGSFFRSLVACRPLRVADVSQVAQQWDEGWKPAEPQAVRAPPVESKWEWTRIELSQLHVTVAEQKKNPTMWELFGSPKTLKRVTVLNCVWRWRDALTRGVGADGRSAEECFLYAVVAPHLIRRDLMIEVPPGRRYRMSPSGNEFLLWLEERERQQSEREQCP